MQLVNFNDCEIDFLRSYGGKAGRKLPVLYNNEQYFLKFPGNMKDKGMKNIAISYSNSPVCEYIGSKIYEMLGIDVHKTVLGTYTFEGKEKIVCACRDFEQDGGKLHEFASLKVSFVPHFTDSNGNKTDGTGTDITEVLKTIEEHPLLKSIDGVKERFWDMFVADAVIGNPDRNNGNWGVLVYKDRTAKMAPVYDNGNCLNNKWDDSKLERCMSDNERFKAQAYKAQTNIFEYKGKLINPYQMIAGMKNRDCNKAVLRLYPKIDMQTIGELINGISCISEVQREFYKKIIQMRKDDVLQPCYENVHKMQRMQMLQKHMSPEF